MPQKHLLINTLMILGMKEFIETFLISRDFSFFSTFKKKFYPFLFGKNWCRNGGNIIKSEPF